MWQVKESDAERVSSEWAELGEPQHTLLKYQKCKSVPLPLPPPRPLPSVFRKHVIWY